MCNKQTVTFYSMLIFRGFTRSDFGSVSVRMPWSIFAPTLPVSIARIQLEHATEVKTLPLAEEWFAGDSFLVSTPHNREFVTLNRYLEPDLCPRQASPLRERNRPSFRRCSPPERRSGSVAEVALVAASHCSGGFRFEQSCAYLKVLSSLLVNCLGRQGTAPRRSYYLAYADVDLLGFSFLGLRQRDREHTIFVLCFHLVRIH